MSEDLYRKEVVAHRNRRLYGDVVLSGSLGSWVITGLLLAVAAILLAGLVFIHVDTDDGSMRLYRWIMTRGA